jgi:hypothetical protein
MLPPQVFERRKSIVTGRENLVKVWDLPGLPFTEFFGEYNPTFPRVDQALMMCPDSGVFQLQFEVEPSFLYHSNNYNFRTLTTPKIEDELDFFIRSSSLDSILNSKSRVLEIGGNNSVLAKKLEGFYSHYVVCDPILEDEDLGDILYWKGLVEDNLVRVEELQPTVIIGRHVLEHVTSPLEMLQALIDSTSTPVIFVFEFPNFRLMQKRQRLDAVFHQHLNYFDENSIVRLIEILGCQVLSLESNLKGSNGGSLVVSFTNGGGSNLATGLRPTGSPSTLETFSVSLSLFQSEVKLLEDSIRSWQGKKAGFGAGLMLATLNYHTRGAIEELSCIYDDDPGKSDMEYQNIRVKILHSSNLVDDESNLLVVTSMENQRAIRNRLQYYFKSTVVGFQSN